MAKDNEYWYFVLNRFQNQPDMKGRIFPEYVMMVLANHEVYFVYNNTVCQIGYGLPDTTNTLYYRVRRE
jgi:predicted transposase YdaD